MVGLQSTGQARGETSEGAQSMAEGGVRHPPRHALARQRRLCTLSRPAARTTLERLRSPPRSLPEAAAPGPCVRLGVELQLGLVGVAGFPPRAGLLRTSALLAVRDAQLRQRH